MSTKASALITGANKGIGFATARQLGEKDYAVWLGCRDQERGEKAAAELRDLGVDAHSLTIDVTSDESVQSAAAKFADAAEKLDVLINNAGVSLGGPTTVSNERIETMRAIFEVNVFGLVRVTQAFLPHLRKAKSARVVMMSSGLGSLAETLDIASLTWNVEFAGYSASKSALNMLTVKFAKELMREGMKVNAADPGFTATDLNGHTGHRSVEEAAAIVVKLATLGAMGPTGGFFHEGYLNDLPQLRW